MRYLTIFVLVGGFSLAQAPVALAAAEQGDAGELPSTAQDLTGAAVQAVDGTFVTGDDQDVYRVCLSGDGSFSATTVGGSTLDTQLFLFDGDGRGVYANDDSGGTRQSTLPAGDPLTPTAPGEYLLAIAPYNRGPQSPLGPIFLDRASLVGATERGAGQALSGWSGRTGASGAYTITLAGTAACSAPDTTPPVIDLRSPRQGQTVGLGESVVVDFSCSDEGGSGLALCEGTVGDGELLDNGSRGERTVSVRARDNAGNESVAVHSVIVSDATAPSVFLRSPLDGAVYVVDQEVPADYDCADQPGGSGLLSCVGDVPDGAPVDTTSVGDKSFTVAAADAAGNTATETGRYRVVFDFGGFLRPIEQPPAVNVVRAGRTMPVKFSLGGFRGLDVLAEGYPQVAETACGSGAQADQGEPARLLSTLRYRRWRGRYRLLWKTDRAWRGTCRQLLVRLADGTFHRADFRFKEHRPRHRGKNLEGDS